MTMTSSHFLSESPLGTNRVFGSFLLDSKIICWYIDYIRPRRTPRCWWLHETSWNFLSLEFGSKMVNKWKYKNRVLFFNSWFLHKLINSQKWIIYKKKKKLLRSHSQPSLRIAVAMLRKEIEQGSSWLVVRQQANKLAVATQSKDYHYQYY